MIAASPSEIELIEGEEMYVVGSAYQAGNVEGTEEIELTATNVETGETTVVDTQELTAAPNVFYLGGLNVTYAPRTPAPTTSSWATGMWERSRSRRPKATSR